MSLIALLLLQNVPAPPPMAPPPIAPPVAPSRSVPLRSDAPAERFTVDLEVRSGNDLLWSGPLRVASGQTTSVRRELSEPSAASCPEEPYRSVEQSSLSVQLNAERAREGASALQISIRWGRPGPNPCAYRGSGRVVELNERLQLVRGSWVSVNGDAGLTVRLRRQ